MNIFPKDLQYFIVQLYFENKKEIILFYTDSNYSDEDLCGYYPPEKVIQEKIKIDEYLFKDAAECGNIRLMIFLYEKKCPWDSFTFRMAANHDNLENLKWLLDNGCPWDRWTFHFKFHHVNEKTKDFLKKNGMF
jgi:hypothetical protein